MLIFRDKKSRPGYPQIEANLVISPEHASVLQKLTRAQALSIMQETETEILRQHMAFAMPGVDPNHVQGIARTKSLVIEGSTQSGFGDGLDEVQSTVVMTRNQFLLSLQRYGTVLTPPLTLKSQ